MAAEFPDRKEQLVFLINNYDMMLAVLTVRHCTTLESCSLLFLVLRATAYSIILSLSEDCYVMLRWSTLYAVF